MQTDHSATECQVATIICGVLHARVDNFSQKTAERLKNLCKAEMFEKDYVVGMFSNFFLISCRHARRSWVVGCNNHVYQTHTLFPLNIFIDFLAHVLHS